MTMKQRDVEVVTQLLVAVERRDTAKLMTLYHPQIEFVWPPGLPYSGHFVGAQVGAMSRVFHEVWHPLQPTDELRRMDFQVVSAGADNTVVVRYDWKGLDRQGRRFQTPTLAEYHVRDGLVARAQMYYFDLPGLISFLANAGVENPNSRPAAS